jgi:hypothetical protein
MPDKYNITELIPTKNKNELSALLTFSGTIVLLIRSTKNGLDAAMNTELASGTTVFQTLKDHWRLAIRQNFQGVHPSAPLFLLID